MLDLTVETTERSYPPQVQACRESLFALIDRAGQQFLEGERIQVHEYCRAVGSILTELACLDRFAEVTITFRKVSR